MVEGPEHRITVHLDELLLARGMTLVELSARVGVTVANLSILKNGRARALRFNNPDRHLRRARLHTRRHPRAPRPVSAARHGSERPVSVLSPRRRRPEPSRQRARDLVSATN